MAPVLNVLFGLFAMTAAVEQIPIINKAKPNIVFFLTDDQDKHMDSLEYMPLLQKYITDKGTLYNSHYCTTAVCCPSRVSLWTGKNAHNTNVTDVFPPYGGFPKFVAQGLNSNYLPIWLQEAGYSTYYLGKLFNFHTTDNYNKPYPAGWTGSDFLLDPFTYQYLNATTQRNQDPPVSWAGNYSTDVLHHKALGLIDEALELENPFFLTIATNAPHSNVGTFQLGITDPDDIESLITPPVSAERHKHLFEDVIVPRRENFNPDDPNDSASWIKKLPKLNETVIEYNDHFYRQRLRALQAVDELVEGVVKKLETAGVLDNTYLIYSTDNGYHISQHRLSPGKECGFEEDINIPLIIRGPGVPRGKVTNVVSAHHDLAPTFLKIAGAEPRVDFDGLPIPLTKKEIKRAESRGHEHVNVEFWGQAIPEGAYGYSHDDGAFQLFARNNTYKGLRLIGEGYNIYYQVWCTNEHELYDLTTDPGQLHNLYNLADTDYTDSEEAIPLSGHFNLSKHLKRVIPRLDALLLVTKSCKGETCQKPWSVLHPHGNVATLHDALHGRFDGFYAFVGQRVGYTSCELGYILDAEGEQKVPVYGVDYAEEEL